MQSRLLKNLLHPILPEEFFGKYWSRRALHISGRIGIYEGLISWHSLSETLSTQRLQYPRVRLVQAGRTFDPSLLYSKWYDRRGRSLDRLDMTALCDKLNSGAMLVFDCIEETTSVLSAVAANLESFFDEYCQFNGYFQITKGEGFKEHADPHDVLVLQIDGQKTWTLRCPSNKTSTVVLRAGDLLYIPRAWPHQAAPSMCGSSHLSIGIEYPAANGSDSCGRVPRYSDFPLGFGQVRVHDQDEVSFWNERRSQQWHRQRIAISPDTCAIDAEKFAVSLAVRLPVVKQWIGNTVASHSEVASVLTALDLVAQQGCVSFSDLANLSQSSVDSSHSLMSTLAELCRYGFLFAQSDVISAPLLMTNDECIWKGATCHVIDY